MAHPNKIQFHSFDAFRFFAFFKVFVFHVPFVWATNYSTFKHWYVEHIKFGGGIGVGFFFVLSGFLITYILTREKMKSGKVNLVRFFVRRAFRIWPLFFLVVLFALFLPDNIANQLGFHMVGHGYAPDWRYSLTFLENYKSIMMNAPPRTTPLGVFWSLCIEEHFYILWMIVFFFIPLKRMPVFLISSVGVAWLSRIFHDHIYGDIISKNADLFTNLDFFAISALLGYYVAKNYDKVSNFVRSIPIAFRYGYVLLVLLILYYQAAIFDYHNWFLDIFKTTIFSLMFTLLLLVFIPQDGRLKISDRSVFTKLGKISYGLYVYHMIWLHMVLHLFNVHGIAIDNWHHYFIYFVTTLSATIVTSYISYRYFEMPILKLREKLFPKI